VGFIEVLVERRRYRVAREILALYGVEVPREVQIGREFQLVHRGYGTVIHPNTVIGDRVRIYHQVTIGRADAHLPAEMSEFRGVEIGDDAVLFPGAKILGGTGITRVGNGTVIAANSVLTRSTGENEIWGGVPARILRSRGEPIADD
jgi:serine O-acetyltransferase